MGSTVERTLVYRHGVLNLACFECLSAIAHPPTPTHPMTGTSVQGREGSQPLTPFIGLLFICPLLLSFVAQSKKT